MRSDCSRWRVLLLACFLPLDVAYGHAFGQRFDLPIPLGYYVSGAAVAVFLSFILIALFAKVSIDGHRHVKPTWSRGFQFRFSDKNGLLVALRIFVLAVFFLTVLAGLIGSQDPKNNLMPTMLWIIWWTGMAFFSALVGNLWALINPWSSFFSLMEKAYLRCKPTASGLSLGLRYPSWLGVWPACLLFWFFVWGELIWVANAVPVNLSLAVIGYSLITWLGMFVFGRTAWLQKGEVFSLVFGLLARFAPLGTQAAGIGSEQINDPKLLDRAACKRKQNKVDGDSSVVLHEWELRAPGIGLLANQRTSASLMFFVLLMLSTVTFDGLMGTPMWANIQQALPDFRPLQPFLFRMEMWGVSREVVIATLGLFLFPALFGGLYLVFAWMMKQVASIPVSDGEIANEVRYLSTMETGAYFVFTLVPIALAYHLAHYTSFLLTVGQLIIPLVSDPFGQQWDLFGTANYKINIAIVDARFVWNTSVVSIVIGHVIAVCLAHNLALRAFNNRRLAVINQLPMLVLMVFYTIFSLWILSQPLVE